MVEIMRRLLTTLTSSPSPSRGSTLSLGQYIPPRRQAAIVWAAALLIGTYDGYYGPGTGTFLMLVFIHLGKMDTRHAAGGVKVINLASNIGGVCSALMGWRPLWPPSWDTIWAPAWPSGTAAKSSGLRWWSCCSCCW